MQRRAALARALVIEPAVLLLDEPTVSLDQALAQRMRECLAAYWRRRGTTVLLVTHDLREAVWLATRIVVLAERQGTVALDRPRDLPHPPRLGDPRITTTNTPLPRHPPPPPPPP